MSSSTLRSQVARLVTDASQRARKVWLTLRFGAITETVKSVDGGVASEIEYRGRGGLVIGYWAYGYFDPSLPYRG